MENKKSGYNGIFWGLGVAAIAGLVGSAYYLYTLVNQDEEFTEDDIMQISELKESLKHEEEGVTENGGLTVEIAVQIMAMCNKISEEMVKKAKPDLDDRRRAAINNPEEYERICQEVFEAKEWAYNEAMQKIFNQFGAITIEEIHKVMQTVPPMEIERINHKYEKHNFDEETKPDQKLVKSAYIFYGTKFKAEMKEFQNMLSKQTQYDPQQDQYFFFRMLTMKMKVDDEVFLRYKYTEPQIKYLLYEYGLLEDPDVKQVNEQLMRFDQMFAPQMDQ